MALEKVREYFKKYDLDSRIKEFEVSSATVELAAEAVGVDPEKIGKTLSFMVNDKPVLIVVSGDAKINGTKFKAQFNTKSKMIDTDVVEELIGHDVGGVCPFAINDGVDVYLDRSIKRFSKVYPASGSSNSIIELTIEEMEEHSGYIQWIDVCKGWDILD